MGLDQYAYVASKAGAMEEHYATATYNQDTKDWDTPVAKPREIAYWRKHPNLQGWMERLWLSKLQVPNVESDQFIQGKWPPCDFNGIELELTWDDITRLEADIESGVVAGMNTTGFFFGRPSDDHYYQQDIDFCKAAKAELFLGLRVFYNSSW